MRSSSTAQRLMAAGCALLLVSCGATRSSYSAPEGQELSRRVLVIQEAPDGQLTHEWLPVSEFDLAKYPRRAQGGTPQSGIVRAAWTRDCEEEFDQCVAMCIKSLTGPDWSHANQGSKARICRDRCLPAYNDCSRLKELAETRSFPVLNDAVDWLKRHRKELEVGTVVVVAGVAFVVIVAGSGGTALILAPAVLLVAAEATAPALDAVAQP